MHKGGRSQVGKFTILPSRSPFNPLGAWRCPGGDPRANQRSSPPRDGPTRGPIALRAANRRQMRPMVDVVWSHPPRPAPPTRREEAFCRKDSGDLIRLSTSEDQLLRCHEEACHHSRQGVVQHQHGSNLHMVLISDIVSPRGVANGMVGRDEMNVRSGISKSPLGKLQGPVRACNVPRELAPVRCSSRCCKLLCTWSEGGSE